jgi:hypothetical protein
MSEWKNEDEIKAELRAMTDELRKLRQGLRNLVSPPKTHPSREFLHRQSWPAPSEPAPPVADDRERPHSNKTRSSRKKPG